MMEFLVASQYCANIGKNYLANIKPINPIFAQLIAFHRKYFQILTLNWKYFQRNPNIVHTSVLH